MSESGRGSGGATAEIVREEPSSSWRLNVKEFKLPRHHHNHHDHDHDHRPRSFTFSGLVGNPSKKVSCHNHCITLKY